MSENAGPRRTRAIVEIPVEDRYRLLIENVREYAMMILDPRGVVATWNPGAERINGWKKEEIVGRSFEEFFTPEDRSAGKPAAELAAASARGVSRDEGWRRRKDGSRFWAAVVVTAIRSPAGDLRGFAKVTRDLTGEREAEGRFTTLLEAAPDAMVIMGSDGKMTAVNGNAERMFGWSRDELVGRAIEILIPERFRARHVGERDGYMRAPRVRPMGAGLALYGRRKDGSEFPVEVSLSPLETQRGRLAIAAVRDVTERRRAEEELERRSRDLSAANEELQAFTSSVAHDLRAPIRQILGFAQLVAEDYGERLDDEGRRRLSKVTEGARRMGVLVDDLLNLSRIGRQAVEARDVDLGELARLTVEELAPEAAGREIEWRVGKLFTAPCDAGLMKQVFVNLISNAIKYTRPRERAVIEVGSRAEASGERVVFVRDNGVGFDMSHAGKLFGIFQRLHADKDFEGTGVGLATVARILRKHGGRIWASAEPGRGATFYFTAGGASARKEGS